MKKIDGGMGDMGFDLADESAKSIQRGIKLRMRNSFSEEMHDTLAVKSVKLGNKNLLAEATITDAMYYLRYQERGFMGMTKQGQPGHFVPASTPTGSGRTFGDWIREKYSAQTGKDMKNAARGLVVKKSYSEGYYILPALMSFSRNFDKIAERIVKKRIEQGI